MKKEEIKVGGVYAVTLGKNEVNATVIRATDAGYIIKTASGKNMPVNNPDRFIECIEQPKEASVKKKAAPAEKTEPKAEKAPAKTEKKAPAKKTEPVFKEEECVEDEEAVEPDNVEETIEEVNRPADDNDKPVEKKAPAKEAKAKKEKPSGNMSMLEAAAEVLKDAEMSLRDIVDAMAKEGLWESTVGKTPVNTLSAAINREIRDKTDSRFKKIGKGLYTTN